MDAPTLSEVSGLFRHIVAALLTVVVVYLVLRQMMTSVERLFGWPAPQPKTILVTTTTTKGAQDDDQAAEVILKCLETIAEESAAALLTTSDGEDDGWSTEDSDCVTVVEMPGLTTPHLLKRLATDDKINNNNNEWTKTTNGTCDAETQINNKIGNQDDAHAQLNQNNRADDRNNNEWTKPINVSCHADAQINNNKVGNHGYAHAQETHNNRAPPPKKKREEARNRTSADNSGSSSRQQMQSTTSLTWPSAEGPMAVRVQTTLSGTVGGGDLEGRTEVLVDFGNTPKIMNGDAPRPKEETHDVKMEMDKQAEDKPKPKTDHQLRRVADDEPNAHYESEGTVPIDDRCSSEDSASSGITSKERLRGLLERASQRRTYAADDFPIIPSTLTTLDSESAGNSEADGLRTVSPSLDEMQRAPKLDAESAAFSAHVTARAVAAEHPQGKGNISSVASARVSSRSEDNPILALACATAQATSAACADASWELLSRRDWPDRDTDISLVVSTACTVPVTSAWTAKHRRSRSEPDLRRQHPSGSAVRSPGATPSRQRHASSGDYFRPPSRFRNRAVPEFRDPAFTLPLRRNQDMKDLEDSFTAEPLPDGVQSVHVREVESMPYPRSPIFARRTSDTLQLGPPPPRRTDRPSTPGSPPSILRTPSPIKTPPRQTPSPMTPSPVSSPAKTPEPPPVPPKRSFKVKRSPPVYHHPTSFTVTPSLVRVNGHHKEDPEEMSERITGFRTASKMSAKPPLPPQHHTVRMTSGVKGRIASARRHYLESQQTQLGQSKKVPDDRFVEFCNRTREERERMSSSPDLAAQEPVPSPPVRRRATIDRQVVSPSSSRSSNSTKPPSRPWPNELTRALLSQKQKRISRSLGFLETDIDTLQSRQVYETDLDGMMMMPPPDLTPPPPPMEDRCRSVDFLLDEDRRADLAPPENRLANGQGRVKSEHELRIERSLQNLHIPEWYKKAELARRGKEGFLLSRRDSSSSQDRWTGLGSRTPSYTSLKDSIPHGVVIPKRVTRPYVSSLRSSRESLPSPGVESLSRWSSSRLSTNSAPVSTWTVYRGFQRPYLGWRAAAASGQTPSPAPSTPLSLSRPVSPGRSPLSTHFHHPEPWSRPTTSAAEYDEPRRFQPSTPSRVQWPTLQQQTSEYEEPRKLQPLTPGRVRWAGREEPQVEEQEERTITKPKEEEGTSEEAQKVPNGEAVQIPRDRYSYMQSIYNSDSKLEAPDEEPASSTTPDTVTPPSVIASTPGQPKSSPTSQVLWVESSFLGTRSTTSVAVMPDEELKRPPNGDLSPPSEKMDQDRQSAASFEEVLDSLLAIPSSSRSSSPVASRRSSPHNPSPSPVLPEKVVTFRDLADDRDEGKEEPQPPPIAPAPDTLTDHPVYLSHDIIQPSDGTSSDLDALNPDERTSEPKELSIAEAPADQSAADSLTATHSIEGEPVTEQATPTTPQHRHPHRSARRNPNVIQCRRPNCKKSLPTEEARAKFRTCPNCYTYYCSRHCRKQHWERHRDQCPYTRISNLCTQVLMKVREEPASRRQLSICARRGYLSRGRGVVKLVFATAEDALDFLCNGWDSPIRGQTFYVPKTELMPTEMGVEVFSQVRVLCERYNPDRKFILLSAIAIINEAAVPPESVLDRELVVRGVKMRLAPPLPEDEVQTLLCTVVKDPPGEGGVEVTEDELTAGFEAIEQQLAERGVFLHEHYPHVYSKIRDFVEKQEPFVPMNIYPTDRRTGKMFMCILLPWADGDIIQKISSKTAVVRSRRRWIL